MILVFAQKQANYLHRALESFKEPPPFSLPFDTWMHRFLDLGHGGFQALNQAPHTACATATGATAVAVCESTINCNH